TCVSGIGGALSADDSRLSTSSLRLGLAEGLSTASRSLSALSSTLLCFFAPGSSFSSLSMNLSSPCLTGGGGGGASATFFGASSGTVGSATSPPRLLVCVLGAAAA